MKNYSKKFLDKCLQITDAMGIGEGHPAGVANKLSTKKNVVTRQSINRYWQALKKAGVVKEISSMVWVVDQKKKRSFFQNNYVEQDNSGDVSRPANTIRAHAFQLQLPYNFPFSRKEREDFLEKNSISFKIIGNKSTWTGHSFKVAGWTVHMTTKSFLFIMPKEVSLFTSDGREAYDRVFEMILYDVIPKIERMLGRKIGRQGQYKLRVYNHHYALIKNWLAKEYVKKKQRFQMYLHDDGKVSVWIDESHSPEVEYGNHEDSHDQSTVHKKFIRSMQDTRMDMFDVRELFAQSAGQIKSNAENFKQYAENIESHIKAIQELGAGVKEQTQLLSEMRGLMPRPKPSLENIKKKLHSLDDVTKNSEEIERLSDEEKLELSNWIMENLN